MTPFEGRWGSLEAPTTAMVLALVKSACNSALDGLKCAISSTLHYGLSACNVRPVLAFWALQAFWLALALPGFALLWRWDRASLSRGSLAALARCYLVSFALLTPVSVLGHLCRWPVWTLSVAYLSAVAGAIAILVVDPSWRKTPRWPSVAAAIGGTLLAVDLLLAARAGTHLEGDAGYHVACVRQLLALGLNNWDPLVSAPRLEPVYHTNLYHALIASSAQLAGCDPVLAWLELWPFAKLLCAGCAYQLAYTLFGQRWLGWVAAIALSARWAAYSVLPFPNTLAPLALLLFGLAAAIDVVCGAPSYRAALWLGAAALALAQVHDLNAIFLGILVVPCLGALLIYRGLRKRPGQLQLLAAMLATGVSLPWLVVPALPQLKALSASFTASATTNTPAASAHTDSPTTPGVPASLRTKAKADLFIVFANGQTMLRPENLRGPEDRNLPGLVALVLVLAIVRRRQLWMLAALLGTACAWLLVPALCTALLRTIGTPWAITRLTGVLTSATGVLVPAALFALLPMGLQRRSATRVPLQLAALGAALGYAGLYTPRSPPWTLSDYLAAAQQLRASTAAEASALSSALLSENIPPGATVMASPRWEYYLPMHHRCHTLALRPGSGRHGLDDMGQRRDDTEEFFARDTTSERSMEILRKYGVRYIYASRNTARRIRVRLGSHVSTFVLGHDAGVLSVAW